LIVNASESHGMRKQYINSRKEGGETRMKKLIIAALAICFIVGITTTAKAVVLGPAGFSLPFGVEPVWGAFVTSTTVPVIYDAINAAVYQEVRLNATGYLFAYQFENFDVEGSVNSIKRMTATDFTGFYTDVDAFIDVGDEILPLWLDRTTSGDAVGFQFLGGPFGGTAVGPGDISAILWIQTDAQYYGSGSAHFINGGTQNVTLYGPAIPEPASMLLLGMGMGMGVLGFLRKRRNA